MAKPVVIFIGVFAAGELPFPFAHTFNDFLGNAIDLAGFTPTVEIEGPDEAGSYGTGSVVVSGPTIDGVVQYTWANADFQDVGKYQMLLWVDDGTNKLASDLIKYEVYDGPGPTPA
jgi:hypothetical protein